GRQGHALPPARLAGMVVDRQVGLVGLRAADEPGRDRPLRPRRREIADHRHRRPARHRIGAAYRLLRLPSIPRTISRPSAVPMLRTTDLIAASVAVSRW